MKVKLTCDLTAYHPSLIAGVEGETLGARGQWSRGSDLFETVRFPETTLDVLWKSLQVTDPEVLARRKEADLALKNATDVIRYEGPKGGLRSLTYRIGIQHTGVSGKEEIHRIESLLRQFGIPIKVERARK